MSGAEDGGLMVWDFRKKGHAKTLEGHSETVTGIQFLPGVSGECGSMLIRTGFVGVSSHACLRVDTARFAGCWLERRVRVVLGRRLHQALRLVREPSRCPLALRLTVFLAQLHWPRSRVHGGRRSLEVRRPCCALLWLVLTVVLLPGRFARTATLWFRLATVATCVPGI